MTEQHLGGDGLGEGAGAIGVWGGGTPTGSTDGCLFDTPSGNAEQSTISCGSRVGAAEPNQATN